MKKIHWIKIVLIASLSLCCGFAVQAGEAEPQKADIISLGFQSLKLDKIELIQKVVMTEGIYRQLRAQIQASSKGNLESGPDDASLKVFARESLTSLDTSFHTIRDVLKQLRFDFSKAKLSSVLVQKPRSSGEYKTQWIEYRSDDLRDRLDIHYVIESEGNIAVVKLNDVFLVDGERYLKSGYRLQAYKPLNTANESINRLIQYYNLNGWIPVVDKLSSN